MGMIALTASCFPFLALKEDGHPYFASKELNISGVKKGTELIGKHQNTRKCWYPQLTFLHPRIGSNSVKFTLVKIRAPSRLRVV